jgi:glutamate carboxypeptidase
VFEAEGRVNEQPSLVIARKGRATWKVTVTGRGAHAGVKHRYGANALVQLSKTIQQIAALTDYSSDLTFNVGTAQGGNGFNRVPHEAFAVGEFRAFIPEVYAHGRKSLLALSGPGEICSPADNYKCSVTIEILNETAPWAPNPQTGSLFELWTQAGTELGLAISPERRAGLSDGNLLYDALPTLDGLGPWGDNDHCSERSADGSKLPEFVVISSFVPKAMLNVAAILKLVQESR